MTLTMSELSGLGQRYSRRSASRATGIEWWGDQSTGAPSTAGRPFDPRLGREVKNIREYQNFKNLDAKFQRLVDKLAKSGAKVEGFKTPHSREGWAYAMKKLKSEAKAAKLRAKDARKAARDKRRAEIRDRYRGQRERRRAEEDRRRAREKEEFESLKKQGGFKVTKRKPPKARYISPARTAGPSISSGGTTITKRVKVPDFAQVVRRPITGGGVTYGQPKRLVGGGGSFTRQATMARHGVATGGPALPGAAISYGMHGLGALAASEGAVLSSLSGGLSGLG